MDYSDPPNRVSRMEVDYSSSNLISRNQNCHSCEILTFLAVILHFATITFLAIFSSYLKIIKQDPDHNHKNMMYQLGQWSL